MLKNKMLALNMEIYFEKARSNVININFVFCNSRTD